MDNFKTILDMKADLFKTKVKDDQRSHTFTNSEGDKRITLGVYVTDGYRANQNPFFLFISYSCLYFLIFG